MSGVGAVTDIKGDELDALTGDLEEISSLATNILENVENEGFKWRDGVTIMTAKAQELDYVEERIQQIAILNADFRNSNEALETMNKIIDARTEVLNTLGEIRNLVLTGETKQDFTQMLISQEKLLKE
jgi:DNA repair ATPase RecN